MKKKRVFRKKPILWTALVVIILIIIGSFLAIVYNLFDNSLKFKEVNRIEKKDKKEIDTQQALKKLQSLVDENIIEKNKSNNSSSNVELNMTKIVSEIKHSKKDNINKDNINIKINQTKNDFSKKVNFNNSNSEAIDYAQNDNQKIKKENINPIIHTNKPKLVIIMDDMSFAIQVRKLKSLHMKITPSFFPPTYNHPNTAKYAKEFDHYMVHFPMQATNPYFHEEPKTLHINSSINFIENRVEFIKKNFSKVEFVNNHTGSKFTSNLKSMERLYKTLDKYHLVFIDSVTTSKSKAPIVAKENHKILLQRDVFLDNFPTKSYIQNQLKLAVRIAKKRGYAIAICHPHKSTFEALQKSKNLLKGVELIYIGEMYEFAKKHHISRL